MKSVKKFLIFVMIIFNCYYHVSNKNSIKADISDIRIVSVYNTLPIIAENIRNISDIKYIVIHHTATEEGTALSIARNHLKRNKNSIAYHYLIQKNGTVENTAPITRITGHTIGVNEISVAICLVGNFEYETPTPEQLESMYYTINVLKKQIKDIKLIYHGQVPRNETSCPGKNLIKILKNKK